MLLKMCQRELSRVASLCREINCSDRTFSTVLQIQHLTLRMNNGWIIRSRCAFQTLGGEHVGSKARVRTKLMEHLNESEQNNDVMDIA